MTINMQRQGSELTIAPEGRLDTLTSPQLEKELGTALDGVQSLVFDFEKLEYLSSAGIRVMLSTYKKMSKQGGSMCIKNVCPEVEEIFEMTGLTSVFGVQA